MPEPISEAIPASVVIRTYTLDRWNTLVAALESLQRQTKPAAQIVVVVDHNPTLMERIKERFPSVDAFENRYPQGSSGAWNSGVFAATQEIIVFMDDDAVASPDWLERLTELYNDEKVGGVGGAIIPNWLVGRPAWFPEEFDWVVGCTYKGLPDKITPVRNLIGCNMSFRRSVFDIVGGFRQGMGHVGGSPVGCDETELCIRLLQRKPESVLLHHPGAAVYHTVPASRSTFRYFIRRCYLEGGSKALVAHYVGAKDGLASERNHVFKTLPQGVMNGLRDTLRGDLSGLGRAAAIIIGLAVTGFNYVLQKALDRRPLAAGVEEVRIAG